MGLRGWERDRQPIQNLLRLSWEGWGLRSVWWQPRWRSSSPREPAVRKEGSGIVPGFGSTREAPSTEMERTQPDFRDARDDY